MFCFQETLNELQRIAPNVRKLDLTQIASFGYAVISPDSSLPDFPMDSLRQLAFIMQNNPSMDVHSAIYRLYPYKLFLPKESIQGVLTLFTSLDISIIPRDQQQRIVSVNAKEHGKIGELITIIISFLSYSNILCQNWIGFGT